LIASLSISLKDLSLTLCLMLNDGRHGCSFILELE